MAHHETTEDIEECTRRARESLDGTPTDLQDRAKQLNDLVTLLVRRHRSTGDITSLDDAVEAAKEAVEIIPDGHRNRPMLLSSLARQLYTRYRRTGVLTDFEAAIEAGRKGIDITPKDHPDRAIWLNNHANKLGNRYRITGKLADLDEGIQRARQAIEIGPRNRGSLSVWMTTLSTALCDRHLRTGTMADLDESIDLARQVVDFMPNNGPNRITELMGLATGLGNRYRMTGTLSDLDEVIQRTRQITDISPGNHPTRATQLGTLATGLTDRYKRMGAIADLDEAIELARQVVNITATSHPKRTIGLSGLARKLEVRYRRTASIANIEEAIQISRQVVNLTPEDHPDQAMHLNNLATALSNRYNKTREMADLEEAIQITRQVIDITPPGHPFRASRVNNLAIKLSSRYKRTGSIGDIDEAIQMARQAVDGTPNNHSERAIWLTSLATRLRHRSRKTNSKVDLKDACTCFQSALYQTNAPAMTRIQAGAGVLDTCPDSELAYEAAILTTSLIPQITARPLNNADKQYALSQVVGLASNAAAAALQAGKGPLAALSLLEQGRGVMGSNFEEMRVDIQDLRLKDPDLADKISRVRNELELAASLGEEHCPIDPVQPDRRHHAGKELDRLVDEARQLPGLGDFLKPPSESDMRTAASFGTIAIINVSSRRCDAILVEQHQITFLALPKLSTKGIQERARQHPSSPKILEWLWDVIASPVLEAFGLTQPCRDENWPQMWWIPTGPLAKFPLHAAGYHKKRSSETVIDRVVSSYGSSIKAIIYTRRRPVPIPALTKALLVAVGNAAGTRPLQFAETEIVTIKSICKSMGLDPIHPEQYKQNILRHLQDSKIFHFAGHGCTDSVDPSNSYLCLRDWKDNPLRVADLFETNLDMHSPFLAYLSACGTGRTEDAKFLDESIHLVSAFQLAGFRHVIGTLWEVYDEFCVDVARITYMEMKDQDMTDRSVGLGLHKACLQLRNLWLAKTTSERASATQVKTRPGSDQINTEGARDKAQEDFKKFRDISDDSDDDSAGEAALEWVPYIHFGV